MGDTGAMLGIRTGLTALLASVVLLAPTGPVVADVRPVGERSVSAEQPLVRVDWRERMLARINDARAVAGSRPLRMCPALTRSAQWYASQMMRDDRVSHTGADGSSTEQRITRSGYRGVLLGENLAAGQATVAKAVDAWGRSSSHFTAMTDPRFRHVGFGYERGRSGQYDTFWVQHFGAGGRC